MLLTISTSVNWSLKLTEVDNKHMNFTSTACLQKHSDNFGLGVVSIVTGAASDLCLECIWPVS